MSAVGLTVVVILALLACHGALTREPNAETAPETGDTAPIDTAEAPTESGDTAAPPIDADADGSPLPDDCDDTRADVYPGATEVCDHVDHDCDGILECGQADFWAQVVDVPLRASTFAIGDLTGDGGEEVLVGDTVGHDGGYGAEAAVVLDVSRVRDGTNSLVSVAVVAGPGGTVTLGTGDVNGDGLADLAILGQDDAYPSYDADWGIWINDGATDGRQLSEGDTSGPLLSVGLVGMPAGLWPRDIDGDGEREAVTQVPSTRLYFSSPARLASGTASFAEFAGVEVSFDDFGSAGDVDGDGLDDVAYSGPARGGVVPGADLVGGRFYAAVDVGGAKVTCPDAGFLSHTAVAAAGDVDRDGLGDVAVRCTSPQVWLGFVPGAVLRGEVSVTEAWATFEETQDAVPFLGGPDIDEEDGLLQVSFGRSAAADLALGWFDVAGGGAFGANDAVATLSLDPWGTATVVDGLDGGPGLLFTQVDAWALFRASDVYPPSP